MPRTTMLKEHYMQADLKNLIAHKKLYMGLTNKDIAQGMNLSERSIVTKINTGDWSRDELIRLFDLLKLTDEEILLVMRKRKYIVKVVEA